MIRILGREDRSVARNCFAFMEHIDIWDWTQVKGKMKVFEIQLESHMGMRIGIEPYGECWD